MRIAENMNTCVFAENMNTEVFEDFLVNDQEKWNSIPGSPQNGVLYHLTSKVGRGP